MYLNLFSDQIFFNIYIADAAWAISYVTDDDNIKIQAVIDAGCVPYLVNLLAMDEAAVIVPALRSVGNIVTGTDTQVSPNNILNSSKYNFVGKPI